MPPLRFIFPCALVVSLLVVGCGDSDDPSTPDSATIDTSSTTGKPAAWSYEDDTGPGYWADLSSAYAACDGTKQSPVNLASTRAPEAPPSLTLSYRSSEAQVVDTGHAVQVNTTGGTLSFGGTTYDLQQFHVHTPSEHTVQGVPYAGEIHLVHQANDNTLAVLGIFVEEGDTPHPHLDAWISGTDTTLSFHAETLLPKLRPYYTYEGSLTTPPCSEIVRWIVLDTPMQASSEQLKSLRAQHSGNARPVQPLNDRTIRYVTGE